MRLILIILIIINFVLATFIIIGEDDHDSIINNLDSSTKENNQPAAKGNLQIKEKIEQSCWVWSVFLLDSNEDYKKWASKINPMFEIKTDNSTAKWWVYLPPQRSLDAMTEKLVLLESNGFKVYPNTTPGKMRWSISMGRFSEESGARQFIVKLKKIGLHSAVLNKDTRNFKRIFIEIMTPPTEIDSFELNRLKDIHLSSEFQKIRCDEI